MVPVGQHVAPLKQNVPGAPEEKCSKKWFGQVCEGPHAVCKHRHHTHTIKCVKFCCCHAHRNCPGLACHRTTCNTSCSPSPHTKIIGGSQIWPVQTVEPIGRHMFIKHTDDERSQHVFPHREAPRLQQMLDAMQSSPGPHTREPHWTEPAKRFGCGQTARCGMSMLGTLEASHP